MTLLDEYEHVNMFPFTHHVPDGVKIVTDYQFVYHCLSNLVSNAHKYGAEDDKIDVVTTVENDHLC